MFLSRLDYQPLFGKGARAPPRTLLGEGRPDTRERRKSSLVSIMILKHKFSKFITLYSLRFLFSEFRGISDTKDITFLTTTF